MTPQQLPQASWWDTARIATAVLLRGHAKIDAGILLRELADRYGAGPLLLRLPGRTVAIVLDPHDARQVLTVPPLAVQGVALAEHVANVVAEETDALPSGPLTWDTFAQSWSRVVHRVVEGGGSTVPPSLRAFDAAGIAVFRALALLATHPEQAAWARADPAGPDLPRLRACVLESARLWPPTPAVQRKTTADTTWRGRVLRSGATVVVVTSFFHRDIGTVPDPDTFAPESRIDDRTDELLPFSAGPSRDLVLLTTSTLLATLLYRYDIAFDGAHPLTPDRPLPATFSQRELTLMLTARTPA